VEQGFLPHCLIVLLVATTTVAAVLMPVQVALQIPPVPVLVPTPMLLRQRQWQLCVLGQMH
jgi:hypothetical protein